MNDPVNMTLSNGCFMAVLGICIVFSGLVLLSLGICLSARLLAWWEARVKDGVVPYLKGALKREGLKAVSTGLAEQTLQGADATDVETSLRRLSDQLGDPFKLPELLRLAERPDAKLLVTTYKHLPKQKKEPRKWHVETERRK